MNFDYTDEQNALRDSLVVPPVPEDLPALPALLVSLAQQPLDPWAVDFLGGPVSPTAR